ncbi:MAG: alpha/beta hydrolase, partial [Myxococcota bacterium]
ALAVSLGGHLVLRAASLAPERIGRSVLWVPGGLVKPPLLPMLSLMGEVVLYSMSPTRRRFAQLMSKTVTEQDAMTMDFLADSFRYVVADRRFPKPLDDGALVGWGAPVMLVAHENDVVFPPDALAKRAQELIPRLDRVLRIDAWKHMPPFARERQRPVMDEIIPFLRGEESLD